MGGEQGTWEKMEVKELEQFFFPGALSELLGLVSVREDLRF